MKFKMSTTSSATASSRDHDVPSAKVIFKTKLCLVSLTRRDGTLMDASSVSEEDIIEICITKGHTHPLGVLHYSAMELVVLFHSTDKLQCATCRIVKVTELQGEAITVKAMAPSEAHIKAYLAMSHFVQIPQMGRESCIHLPNKLPQARGCCVVSKQNLETLPTMSCVSSWRTLHKKLHNVQSKCAPQQSPPNTWVCPLGSRNPKEDDQEVTFPGGGRWGPFEATHSISRA